MSTSSKRLQLAPDGDPSVTSARILLLNLPIEILAEILLCTRSPLTVLAVSRTCTFLYRSLVQNPGASFIWRGVRSTCKPHPLPEPDKAWLGSEADYAAFVFGGGTCEVCQKHTRKMYVSFAARLRLCGSWHCRSKFLDESLVNVTTRLEVGDRQLLWVPPMESTRCFYPSRVGALVWPRGEILLRLSDWEVFQGDLQAFRDAEKAQAEGTGNEQTERDLERCHAALERLPRIMEVSERLIRWKWDYDRAYKDLKSRNDIWTRNLAILEGWDLEDLIVTQTYGSLQRRKNLILEVIEKEDVTSVRSTIEAELLALKARHRRQEAEATYREKSTEVKKMYERLRCGTLDSTQTESPNSSEPFALPPFSIFCTLPSVRSLKGSPDPSVAPPGGTLTSSDISSTLAITLIKTDVQNWLVRVQKHLMTLLGYPNGWQSASTQTLHPLKRLTARFFCRRCGEGKVGRAYKRERCLDFEGVCSHVCKSVRGRREDGKANAQDGQGQGRGKKKGNQTLDWTVDVFEKDDKAISFIDTLLKQAGLLEDSPYSSTTLEAFAGAIRCTTCPGWITMDPDTAIGHVHRHEMMEVQMLLAFIKSTSGLLKTTFVRPEDQYGCVGGNQSMLAFERGNVELLLGPSLGAKNLCKKVNYGCKHCFVVDEVSKRVTGAENKGLRAMSFHGLRSHVKEKHGIQEIGDEDFFCYTRIRKEGKEKRGG